VAGISTVSLTAMRLIFGSVIAWGDSVKSATRKCVDIMKEIHADEMEYDTSVFDKANEAIEAGREFGINF